MRAVNLLPKDETRNRQQAPLPAPRRRAARRPRRRRPLRRRTCRRARSSRPDPTVAHLQAQDARIPKPGCEERDRPDARRPGGPRVTALGQALSYRIAWDRLLREVSQVLPTDVWLGDLTLTAPNSPTRRRRRRRPTPGAPATGLI